MSFKTMEIQRHLLKILTTNKVLARPYILKVQPQWFTGYRRLIFQLVQDLFKVTPSLLTKQLFEAEIAKLLPDPSQQADRDKYLTEWIIIQQATVHESIDALIEKLKEKEQIEAISKICEQTLGELKKGDIKAAASTLKNESIMLDTAFREEKPLINMTDIKDLDERIQDQQRDPAKYGGIRTGLGRFDHVTGGVFRAEMTLFAAITGVGKSTLLKQIGYNIVMGNQNPRNPLERYPGKNVLHITNEEHQDQVRLKYCALFANLSFDLFKKATISDAELESWRRVMKELEQSQYGRLYIKDIGQHTTVAEIYQAFMELEQKGVRIDVVILDYMDHLSPMQKAFSENDEQAKIAWDCKGLSVDLNVPLITATQAATIVETKQEKGRRFGKLDVYGSKRRIHASNTFVGVMVSGFDDSQLIANGGDREDENACDKFWTAEVCKDRDGRNFTFELRHKVKTGYVVDEHWSKGGTGATGAVQPKKIDKVIQQSATSQQPVSASSKPVEGSQNTQTPETSENTTESSEKTSDPLMTGPAGRVSSILKRIRQHKDDT